MGAKGAEICSRSSISGQPGSSNTITSCDGNYGTLSNGNVLALYGSASIGDGERGDSSLDNASLDERSTVSKTSTESTHPCEQPACLNNFISGSSAVNGKFDVSRNESPRDIDRILLEWLQLLATGVVTALMAYSIAVTDPLLRDYKEGYCQGHLFWDRQRCCQGNTICDPWLRWSDFLWSKPSPASTVFSLITWNIVGISLAAASALITLSQRRKMSPDLALSYFFYPVAGSGVPEVKLRSEGIELPGYFTFSTMISKFFGIILSSSSGLCLGKEGPYVHIATCIGNVIGEVLNANRLQQELLSLAGSAAGLSVAFGAPLAGTIFVVEKLSARQFSNRQFIQIFCCCMVAASSLKYLDPYSTKKIVMFHVHGVVAWRTFEMPVFILVGICGGLSGGLFVKAARLRVTISRKYSAVANNPLLETVILAFTTTTLTFWNQYTRFGFADTLSKLATPCKMVNIQSNSFSPSNSSHQVHDKCPSLDQIPGHIGLLAAAFLIMAPLTVLAFGLKLPAGIYVPTMVLGALIGKAVGHVFQLFLATFWQALPFIHECNVDGLPCISPGIYAIIGAGAFTCGVTHLPITLTIALLEITESLEHLVPFSIALLVSKWAAELVEQNEIYEVVASLNGYNKLRDATFCSSN